AALPFYAPGCFPGHSASPFATGRTSPFPDKLLRKEKFASEIFRNKPLGVLLLHRKRGNDRFDLRLGSKQREINGFGVACGKAKGDLETAGHGRLRKRSCEVHRLPSRPQ